MGAVPLPDNADGTSSLVGDYWELRRRYETVLEALRGIYHNNTLEPDCVETVETLFAKQNQPL